MSFETKPGSDLKKNMQELRERVLADMETEFKERFSKNAHPSEEELRLGAFREWLEPQVRDATFELMKKGYSTHSSGFGGVTTQESISDEAQCMDGHFEVDEKTKKVLAAMGVQVLNGPDIGLPYADRSWTRIRFFPKEADIDQIKRMWDGIAVAMPKRSDTPGISAGCEDFRKKYAPEHPSLERELRAYAESIGEIVPRE